MRRVVRLLIWELQKRACCIVFNQKHLLIMIFAALFFYLLISIMSGPPPSHEKQKPRKFMLPSALRHLQQTKRVETQHFIKQLEQLQQQPTGHQPKRQKKQSQSLFKLNPSSTALVSQIPVDLIRQRSKSNRLESLLHIEPKESFSLLDHLKSGHEKRMEEKRPTLKKYNIDLRQLTVPEATRKPENMEEEEAQKYQIVKPSNTYTVSREQKDQILQPTIFQTPILPCFSSEFHARGSEAISKKVNEGEGVWLVGKLKVKGKQCQLKVGQFQFEGSAVRGEGKAGVISGSHLLGLPNWREMWILQPSESIFL